MSAITDAADRLSRAALAFGDVFARDEDPRWPIVQELEAAAIHYRNTLRAAEGASQEEPCTASITQS